MKVVSICRSRSGLAWASCSCRKWAGSILLGAVIASNSWVCGRSPEDHAVAAFTFEGYSSPSPSNTTLVDATRCVDADASRCLGRATWSDLSCAPVRLGRTVVCEHHLVVNRLRL